MLKRVETSLLYGLNAVKDGTFRGQVHTFNLAEDGVGYSTTHPARSRSIVDRLEVLKGQIASGQIKVAATHAEARRLPGFPQNLRAVDD
jgi:basic membrane lipoprotein Med (substrate-binding protein (PBP1-ABC) superfamily)